MRLGWWGVRLGQPDLSAITLAAVEQALSKAPGSAPKTKHDYCSTLLGFLSWCRKHGYMATNPLVNLGRLDHAPITDWRALTEAEIHRLLAVAPPERQLLYSVAVCTGLRVGEINALRVSQLDTINCCLRQKADDAKNRRKAAQPLPQAIAAKLAQRAIGKRPDAQLLPVPYHYTEAFWADCKAADIHHTPEGRAVFHSLRKSFCTLLQEISGASLAQTQALARHSSPVITANIYTKTANSRLASLVDSLASRLLA